MFNALMALATVPTIKLNNGVEMPRIAISLPKTEAEAQKTEPVGLSQTLQTGNCRRPTMSLALFGKFFFFDF